MRVYRPFNVSAVFILNNDNSKEPVSPFQFPEIWFVLGLPSVSIPNFSFTSFVVEIYSNFQVRVSVRKLCKTKFYGRSYKI